mgnify:CR=1 FL=1
MPATDPTPPAVGEIRGEPLLGSLRWMWRDRLQFYTSLARRPEPILRFFIGPLPLYFVNAPTAIREVLLHDAADGTPGKITLCYPADAEPAAGFVSVLSPVGQALLGLQAGELARWTTPDGRMHAARIEALLFQPEASGDYTL